MQNQIAHNLEAKERTKDVVIEENITFNSLLLSTEIKNGLYDSGFKKPSPIQFKAIPLGRCGFDLIVKSKSGTGKTLVFSTIALEAINLLNHHLQVLILVPTREIAVQIQDVLRSIGRYIEGVKIESFIGGLPLEDDIKKAKGCHIAVGAPGRVKHLLKLGSLSTKSVKLFVLDEADKLMETTFKTDINEIYDSLPQRKQIIAASATYPKELDHFLANYMLSPTHVTSENETPLLLGLRQFAAIVKATTVNPTQQMKAKNEILLDVLSKVSFTQCLVFTNYQTRTESVCNFLKQKGWGASFISAAVEQTVRLEAINNLKNFKSRILLSTDLTSRGIDASNVDLIINYDLPHDAVTYLHRMGRAGRYGSPGICINFALEELELKKMQLILGTIASTNLPISILPELDGVDLWKIDPASLEQIWGILPSDTSNDVSDNIKKEVMTMKQANSKKKSDKNGKKKIKLEELGTSEFVESILKKKEEETEDFESELDPENLLNLLIIEGDEEDSKKRKRPEQLSDSKSTDKLKKIKEESSRTNATFLRNKALLGISRILCNTKIDEDIVGSIDEYLNDLKTEESNIADSVTVEDILEIKPEKISLNTFDVIEDIFQNGYHSAIQETNWLNNLPEDELKRFQEFCRGEVYVPSDDEPSDDYQMESEESEAAATLEWVPVVQQPQEAASSENFEKCYEDCSTVLWQNGLTFETVAEFDNWFYQWQEQLHSVRGYIQQNIYVAEMSKYQQSRQSDK